MISRARAILTGLTAVASLAALVAGLPVVLYRFGGSPLPAHLAGSHQLASLLTSRDDGGLLIAVIRDCSWLAWLAFTACVLAELQAVARGRHAPHLRVGGLQSTAAHLVALAALAFTAPAAYTLSASVAAVASQHSPATTGDLAPGQQPPASPRAPAVQTDALGAIPAPATRLITVRPGDCLWSIAERYLGAGDKYPEIVSLNYGHQMAGGEVFTNPSLIEPGWQLFVPGDAAGRLAATATSGSHHLGHGTRDSRFQRRHPAARQRTPEDHAADQAGNVAARAAAGSLARAGAISDPRATAADPAGAAGGELTGESAGIHTPAKTGELLPQSAMFITGALAGTMLTSLNRLRLSQRQARRRGRRIALSPDPDVLAAEQRLRAFVTAADGAAPKGWRTARSAATDMSEAGSTDTGALENGVLETEPLDTVPLATGPLETLRDALSCLEAGIISTGQELPDIVGLYVTADVLEVLLSEPAADAPPYPYAISPGRQGMCWRLGLPAIFAGDTGQLAPGCGAAADHGCHLLAGLVTAGLTGEGYLLLDLEALRVTGCDGSPELIDQVVTTIATELATGQWSGWYDLILVGCDELAPLGRAEHCATFGEALAMLESRAAVVEPRLAERAPADMRELRLAEPGNEDWGLTILVSRTEPTPAEMQRLLELAEDGPGGFAAFVAGDPETSSGRMAPTVLQLAPEPELPGGIIANLVPLQITMRPCALSGADYEAIATLFTVAADTGDVSQEQEPYVMYGAPPWIPQAAVSQPQAGSTESVWPDDAAAAETPGGWDTAAAEFAAGNQWPPAGQAVPPWSADHSSGPVQAGPTAALRLEVKVLGPFTITGAADQLQPKQAELVLALALAAPAGLSNSALCSMLGPDPDHPKPGDAVRQIITRTRRRLGPAPDGQEYIIHAGNGQYLMHPDVLLDWSQFRQLVAAGRADDLRAAVALISGQPFTGSYFWWIDIPLLETVRAELVDAAETLSEFELATGSARAAARAARAGLLAEASAEQLWRALMRAEHAAGNLTGVTGAWRHCLDAIEDIAPGGEPHPDTEALYRQLTTSRQRTPVV